MILAFAAALSVASPTLPPRDVRHMIRAAMTLVRRDGNAVWPGFKAVPFHMILVGPDTETLFCQHPTRGFRAAGIDPITRCSVQTRKRVLDVDLAASFGFDDEPSMIAFGLPAALGLDRTDWILTLAHEAFHQYQSRIPGYATKVTALGLAGRAGGSWMLDYPFPYTDPAIGSAMDSMAAAALTFRDATSAAERSAAIASYLKARRAAMAAVTPAQQRYFEFQVGQEGIARWTERALAIAASWHDPVMAKAADMRRRASINSLRAVREQGVRVWKRGAFYEFGAIEADMLDALGERWRRAYPERPFSFGVMLERACARAACSA